MTTYVCRSCAIEKPVSDFTPNRWTPVGHTLKCKKCCSEYAKTWRDRNPEGAREQERRKYAKWRLKNPLTPPDPRENADGRLCSACKTRKPSEEFGLLTTSKDGRSNRCKECTRESSTICRYSDVELSRAKDRAKAHKRYWKDPVGRAAEISKTRLKYRYGICNEVRLILFESQGGRCAICRKEITIPEGKRSNSEAHIDHDHATGAIRGLLCVHCNHGLGKFQDNLDILRSAIQYLENAVTLSDHSPPPVSAVSDSTDISSI